MLLLLLLSLLLSILGFLWARRSNTGHEQVKQNGLPKKKIYRIIVLLVKEEIETRLMTGINILLFI